MIKKVLLFVLALVTIAALLYGGVASISADSDLPDYIGERCNHSTVFTDKIPAQSGQEHAYNISLPQDSDIVACSAFFTDANDNIIQFGFDAANGCKQGYCVDGMAGWKAYNDYQFSFWYELSKPVKVEVWFRRIVDDREITPAAPTPTPNEDREFQYTPTVAPTVHVDPVFPFLNFLPFVRKPYTNPFPGITMMPPDPRTPTPAP